MSEINTEQDNKKEQALETTQKIKKPEINCQDLRFV